MGAVLDSIGEIARGIGVKMPTPPQKTQRYEPPAPKTYEDLRDKDKRKTNLPRITLPGPTLRKQIEDSGGVLSRKTLGTTGGTGGSGTTTRKVEAPIPGLEATKPHTTSKDTKPYVPPTPKKTVVTGGGRIVAS